MLSLTDKDSSEFISGSLLKFIVLKWYLLYFELNLSILRPLKSLFLSLIIFLFWREGIVYLHWSFNTLNYSIFKRNLEHFNIKFLDYHFNSNKYKFVSLKTKLFDLTCLSFYFLMSFW